jgi:hypothetical protein
MQSATESLSLELAGRRIACRLDEIRRIRAGAEDDERRTQN